MSDRTQRIEHIQKSIKAAVDNNGPISRVRGWREGTLEGPEIKLDISFLRYRIENSRTRLQQLGYLHKHPDLPADLFKDPESNAAQKAQEEILTSMVQDPEFQKDLIRRGQDEPAIITYDGFIVNGNRRTAALKLIGKEYVNCLVLPSNATKKEIYEFEQELQIAEDFKEEYHWINELCNIREGLQNEDFGITKEHMAAKLRMDEKEIDQKLNMLSLIDGFLFWKGIPGQYDYEKIDQARQVFKQLEKALRTETFRNNVSKQDTLKNMIYTLIEEKPEEERLYKWVSKLIKNFDQNYIAMVEGINTSGDSSTSNQSTGAMIHDLIDSDPNEIITFKSEVFIPSDAKENSENLAAVIEKIEELNREQDRAEIVYDSVSSALRELQGIFITSEHTKLEATRTKLEEIIKKSQNIINEIDKVLSENKP
jgi:hypothetical protein